MNEGVFTTLIGTGMLEIKYPLVSLDFIASVYFSVSGHFHQIVMFHYLQFELADKEKTPKRSLKIYIFSEKHFS